MLFCGEVVGTCIQYHLVGLRDYGRDLGLSWLYIGSDVEGVGMSRCVRICRNSMCPLCLLRGFCVVGLNRRADCSVAYMRRFVVVDVIMDA